MFGIFVFGITQETNECNYAGFCKNHKCVMWRSTKFNGRASLVICILNELFQSFK